MPRFDTVVRNGMIIDGTRAPRFFGDVGIKDGRIAEIGKLEAHDGVRRDRRCRTDCRTGVYRSAHSLRRAGFLGSALLDFGMARRDLGRDRKLRLRLRARSARAARARDAYDDSPGEHSVCLNEGRYALGLGDVSAVSRQPGASAQGRQSAALCPPRAAHHVGDGKSGGGQASAAHRRRRARDSPPFQRGHGRRRMRLVGAAPAPRRSGLPTARL